MKGANKCKSYTYALVFLQDKEANLLRLRRLKAVKEAQVLLDERTIADLLEQNLIVWRKRVEKVCVGRLLFNDEVTVPLW